MKKINRRSRSKPAAARATSKQAIKKNGTPSNEFFGTKKGFFRSILDSLEEYAVYTTDRDGVVSSWNLGAEVLLGYSEDEVVGEHSDIFFTKHDVAEGLNDRKMRTALRKGRASNEHWYVRKDKTLFWGGGTTFPLRDHRGAVRGFTRIVRDLTRRKKLEEEQRRSLHILESITDAFFAMDEHGVFTYVNRQAEHLLQRSRAQLIGKNIWKEFPGARQTIVPKYFDKALKKKVSVTFEVCFEPLNRWFSVRVYPLSDGLAVYFNDIDDEKKTTEHLERSERQLKALFTSNIIGVSYVNLNGAIHEANDYFLDTLGYTRKDLEHHLVRWDTITPPQYKELDARAVRSLLATGVAKPWEKEYIRKDGTKIPVIVAATLLNKERQEAMALIIDISERKEIERSKDEFISVASHELKTPVTSIKLFSEILQDQAASLQHPELAESASIIIAQINRLTSLISDLLDVSRIQSDKLQLTYSRFNANALIKNMISDMPNLRKSHAFAHTHTEKVPVYADRERLTQVLTNLFTNAVKYSPQARKVVVRATYKKHGTMITVQDFGFGIPHEEQKKIFGRFFRTTDARKNNIPGFGLGLHISAEIIRRHGGTLSVKSEVGKGSSFSVFLPHRKTNQKIK